ncbi:LPXTG cell wall anchor domain-containing protein [Cellulomonas hominis]|nr:LPXTG cell wall anchor domain-containing protein [Cellulomonas hominis]VTR76865.1 hypothetical protein CHMI_01632 [Cellulomonas hominis]
MRGAEGGSVPIGVLLAGVVVVLLVALVLHRRRR